MAEEEETLNLRDEIKCYYGLAESPSPPSEGYISPPKPESCSFSLDEEFSGKDEARDDTCSKDPEDRIIKAEMLAAAALKAAEEAVEAANALTVARATLQMKNIRFREDFCAFKASNDMKDYIRNSGQPLPEDVEDTFKDKEAVNFEDKKVDGKEMHEEEKILVEEATDEREILPGPDRNEQDEVVDRIENKVEETTGNVINLENVNHSKSARKSDEEEADELKDIVITKEDEDNESQHLDQKLTGVVEVGSESFYEEQDRETSDIKEKTNDDVEATNHEINDEDITRVCNDTAFLKESAENLSLKEEVLRTEDISFVVEVDTSYDSVAEGGVLMSQVENEDVEGMESTEIPSNENKDDNKTLKEPQISLEIKNEVDEIHGEETITEKYETDVTVGGDPIKEETVNTLAEEPKSVKGEIRPDQNIIEVNVNIDEERELDVEEFNRTTSILDSNIVQENIILSGESNKVNETVNDNNENEKTFENLNEGMMKEPDSSGVEEGSNYSFIKSHVNSIVEKDLKVNKEDVTLVCPDITINDENEKECSSADNTKNETNIETLSLMNEENKHPENEKPLSPRNNPESSPVDNLQERNNIAESGTDCKLEQKGLTKNEDKTDENDCAMQSKSSQIKDEEIIKESSEEKNEQPTLLYGCIDQEFFKNLVVNESIIERCTKTNLLYSCFDQECFKNPIVKESNNE